MYVLVYICMVGIFVASFKARKYVEPDQRWLMTIVSVILGCIVVYLTVYHLENFGVLSRGDSWDKNRDNKMTEQHHYERKPSEPVKDKEATAEAIEEHNTALEKFKAQSDKKEN